jgi:DNA-binding transcriptional LysR family regulator
MDYGGWKLFIDAIELGSLSKVAIAYGTSQPHVSRQVSELERECGGRLFQRTGRGVVLTELGERVAPKVRAWLASTDQLANDIHTTAGKPIGRVRLCLCCLGHSPTPHRAGTLTSAPLPRGLARPEAPVWRRVERMERRASTIH